MRSDRQLVAAQGVRPPDALAIDVSARISVRRGSGRVSNSVPAPAQVIVQLVARNEAGSDPAGDRLQLAVADQCANLVLGAGELGRNLPDGEGCGPVHA
jgi:hypothetical protein